jgi:hypothetical protein
MELVIASTIAQAAATFINTKTTAAAGKRRADLETQAHKTNAQLAELQALQQEGDRRKDWEMIAASNNAAVDHDPFSSPSFLAVAEENKNTLTRDIDNIQLMGQINKTRSLQSASAAKAESSGFRTMGRYAFLKPAGILGEGYYKSQKLA